MYVGVMLGVERMYWLSLGRSMYRSQVTSHHFHSALLDQIFQGCLSRLTHHTPHTHTHTHAHTLIEKSVITMQPGEIRTFAGFVTGVNVRGAGIKEWWRRSRVTLATDRLTLQLTVHCVRYDWKVCSTSVRSCIAGQRQSARQLYCPHEHT